MPGGPILHSFHATNLDGDPDRVIDVKIDSTYDRIDEMIDAIMNDQEAQRALAEDPVSFLASYGVMLSGPGAVQRYFHLPDPELLASAMQRGRTLLEPGTHIQPRKAGAMGIAEVVVAISLWVV